MWLIAPPPPLPALFADMVTAERFADAPLCAQSAPPAVAAVFPVMRTFQKVGLPPVTKIAPPQVVLLPPTSVRPCNVGVPPGMLKCRLPGGACSVMRFSPSITRVPAMPRVDCMTIVAGAGPQLNVMVVAAEPAAAVSAAPVQLAGVPVPTTDWFARGVVNDCT